MSGILIGKGEKPVHLLAGYGNRHGLIAGATGTGKSVSLMVLAEGFSRLGVCWFSDYLTQFFLIVLIRFSDCFADGCGQQGARRAGRTAGGM